ncbi:MAG TPA: DUF3524 domain-containing protein, partial [Acidimicrobiia bacterium]|nr:DUF3524 domain-containing protein [Acidimicrobiia bacterium]
DMVDLAHFRTFARPFIGDVPTVLYFHETQLTYPTSGGGSDVSYSMTNWLSALAADRVLFNSGYHQDVFFEHLPELLSQPPDHTHVHLVDTVRAKSEVLPVGVDLSWVVETDRLGRTPRVLWNHRWEFDKDPDRFAEAVVELSQSGVDFELVLVGYRPTRPPEALERIRAVAADRIVHDGEAPVDLYRKLVASCHIVVSTAVQEFFGISVVEAIAAGSRPVLPHRLSYQWLIPDQFHDLVLYPDGGFTEALATAIDHPSLPPGLAESMHRFSWTTMAPEYDRRLAEIADR